MARRIEGRPEDGAALWIEVAGKRVTIALEHVAAVTLLAEDGVEIRRP